MRKLICVMVLSGILGTLVVSADWPQYRGPNGDGVSREKLVWSGKPKTIWQAATNLGFSSFAVGEGKAFTLVVEEVEGNSMEVCKAFEAASGKVVWSEPLGFAKYQKGGDKGTKSNRGGDGCRSTPSVDAGYVYVLDARLNLYCLSVRDGKKVWSHDLEKKFGAENIKWQNAASPLLFGDFVYVMGGGKGQSFLAFNKKSGRLAWKTGSSRITHATPISASIHGVDQVIFFAQDGLFALNAKNGEQLWFQKFPYKVSSAASPVVDGDVVFCSAGYGVGSGAYQIVKQGSGYATKELWRKEGNDLCNHWSTPVCVGGHLYGMFSFKEFGDGPLSCVDIRTGKISWEQEGFGPGNCIAVDGHILALSDKGEVVLVETSSKAYKEIGRSDELEGKCWSTPVVSDGHVFIRSTLEGKCLQF